MSGFKFVASEVENAAAEMLRNNGWTVDEPRCPECRGHGHRTLFKDKDDYVVGEGLTYQIPCSLGCPDVSIGEVLGRVIREAREYETPPARSHTEHVYRWSEVKAARHGGPPPRCRFCDEPSR